MKKTRKISWFVFTIVLLIPFSLAISSVFAKVPIPAGVTTIDTYKEFLKSLESDLNNGQMSQEGKDLAKKKYDLMAHRATQWAQDVKTETVKTYVPPAKTETPPTIVYMKSPDGIDYDPIIPIPQVFPKDMIPLNGWHKEMGNEGTLFVYAGFVAGDPSQGIVIMKEPGKTLKFKKFPAPKNSGGLRIVAEDGRLLILQGDTCPTFYFDTQKESFVNKDGNVILFDENEIPTPTDIVGQPYP
jgi:hypothetical protein